MSFCAQRKIRRQSITRHVFVSNRDVFADEKITGRWDMEIEPYRMESEQKQFQTSSMEK